MRRSGRGRSFGANAIRLALSEDCVQFRHVRRPARGYFSLRTRAGSRSPATAKDGLQLLVKL
jgi:hypothetical protein